MQAGKGYPLQVMPVIYKEDTFDALHPAVDGRRVGVGESHVKHARRLRESVKHLKIAALSGRSRDDRAARAEVTMPRDGPLWRCSRLTRTRTRPSRWLPQVQAIHARHTCNAHRASTETTSTPSSTRTSNSDTWLHTTGASRKTTGTHRSTTSAHGYLPERLMRQCNTRRCCRYTLQSSNTTRTHHRWFSKPDSLLLPGRLPPARHPNMTGAHWLKPCWRCHSATSWHSYWRHQSRRWYHHLRHQPR